MIAEVVVKCTFVVEAQTLDDAEELIACQIDYVGDHPSLLEYPDPSVKARKRG